MNYRFRHTSLFICLSAFLWMAVQHSHAEVTANLATTLGANSTTPTVSLETGVAHLHNATIPHIAISYQTDALAAKLVVSDHYALARAGVASDSTFAYLDGGYSKEGVHTGKRVGGGVAYVTDGGSMIGVRGSHTRVNGAVYPEQVQKFESSSTSAPVTINERTTSRPIGRTEREYTHPEYNWSVTTTYRETTTKYEDTRSSQSRVDTIHTTDTYITNSGRHGSKTNKVELYGEANTGNLRPYGAAGYTERKYDDGSKVKYQTGTIGARYYGENGNISAEVSKNWGDNKQTGYNVRGEYNFTDNLSGFVAGGRDTEIGNNVQAGLRYIWGGSKSARPTHAVAPADASAYMNRTINATNITEAPSDLQNQTKYYTNTKHMPSSSISSNITDNTPVVTPRTEIENTPIKGVHVDSTLWTLYRHYDEDYYEVPNTTEIDISYYILGGWKLNSIRDARKDDWTPVSMDYVRYDESRRVIILWRWLKWETIQSPTERFSVEVELEKTWVNSQWQTYPMFVTRRHWIVWF